MVYSYVLGKNSDRPTLVFDAAKLRYHCSHMNAITALLLVDQQINDEALAVLYKQNAFYALLGEENFSFDNVPYEEDHDKGTPRALPYGWDLSRIEHLCIGVELAYIDNNAWNDTVNTLQLIRLSALLRMTGLRSLRFFIVTGAKNLVGAAPIYNDLLHDGGKMPNGTVWYRQIMRNLITVVPMEVEVRLGLGERDIERKYYEAGLVGWDVREGWRHKRGDDPMAFVPQEFREKT
jgi:hypothetical protein